MMICLEVPEGPHRTPTPHTYRQDRVRIGSGETNDITLRRDGVSRYHAVIGMEEGQGVLTAGMDGGDLAVNGTPVSGRTLLQPGDVITVGPVEIGYRLVPFPLPEKRRRVAMLEWVTLGLLLAGALGQLYFLLIPSVSLRREVNPELLHPTPTPVPEPTPAPGSEPTPVPTPTPMPLVELPGGEPTATPAPAPTPPSDTRSAEELTRAALARLAENQELQGERLLRDAMERDPGYLPARVELARVLADQLRLADSIRLWEEVRDLADPGSREAMDARLEIASLRRRQQRLEREAEVPGPRNPDVIPTATPRFVPDFPDPEIPVREQTPPAKVGVIRMERYAESPRYDDFRMLNFQLVHPPGTPAVPPGSLKVRVTFFEQAGTRVRQAAIPEPRVVLNVAQGLSGDRTIDLSAAYEVPKGEGADGRVYYGAVIEVFQDGQEIHRAADPAFLLDFVR